MKRYIFQLFLLVGISHIITAQNVGINSTGAAPNASAMLDIVASDKGLLVPRVALTAANVAGPITAPLTSLLVYNTATAGVSPNNVSPGFYYWDGAKWVAFSGSGGKDWALLGNAGTTSGTNFVGTTDAQALDFKTNNTLRFRIPSSNQVHAMSLGTAALPFYSWSADPNTGIWSSGADQLNFSTNGLQRMVIDAGGNLGVQGFPTTSYVNGPQIVNNIFYPTEIGNDGGGGYQASIGWYNSSDVIIGTERDFYGYVGQAASAWYRMYSYGFINSSSRSKKRNIVPIVGNSSVENYVMNSINNMQTYFYKYNHEEDNLDIDNYTKYRPMMHLGTILEESPDFLKDESFHGIDIYAVGTLALSGVKINHNEIKKIKSEMKKISDFGSVVVSNNKLTVPFNEDFSEQIPVITLTSSTNDIQLSIVSKSSKEFIIEIKGNIPKGASIDWIAMARRKQNTETKDMNIDPQLKNQLEIDEATKQKLFNLHEQKSTITPK